jgi:hypothetical protein
MAANATDRQKQTTITIQKTRTHHDFNSFAIFGRCERIA